jgi:hypothetical protein
LIQISIVAELVYLDDIFTIGLITTIMLVIIRQVTVILENKKLLKNITKLNSELKSKVAKQTKQLEKSN